MFDHVVESPLGLYYLLLSWATQGGNATALDANHGLFLQQPPCSYLVVSWRMYSLSLIWAPRLMGTTRLPVRGKAPERKAKPTA